MEIHSNQVLLLLIDSDFCWYYSQLDDITQEPYLLTQDDTIWTEDADHV